ncbi:MAG: energy-coupled thiamine transporter ThiT [Clostridiales bacterium]|nr:energy-coupled thiamine transporter ThiT [Clostridiales bacterium]
MKNTKVLKLAECAILIALSTVLSMINIMPFLQFGGSVTPLSMLPVILISIKYGLGWGFGSSFVYAVIQMLIGLGPMMGWGLSEFVLIGSVVLDYFVAFTILGIAGIARKKGIRGMLSGIVLALTLRFLSHFLSGIIFFSSWAWEGWNVYLYSIVYNGSYMLPELIFTLFGAYFIIAKTPYMRRLTGIDN